MKYITATINSGGQLVCNLDYYIDSEGKTQFFPLIQNSVNYYAFRLITNNLPEEWRDILQASDNRWVIFQNTKLADDRNTTAMPLTPVIDRGMLYLQAVIPPYILALPGVLSITILFTLNDVTKTLATVSQNESDFEPLRILPANNSLDKSILNSLSIEDKSLYHKLIGILLSGSDGQVLQKNSASGTMGYTWVDGSKLSSGIIFGGYVTPYTNKNGEIYVLADITPTARTAIFGEGSSETQIILLNQATSNDLINGIQTRGWSQCTNMQFLALKSIVTSDGLNASVNDYLLSDGEKWNTVTAVDKTMVEQIVADSYVPWNYGSNSSDTEKLLNKVNISGNAGSADKVNHTLTIGPLNFDGSEDKTVESINGSWLTEGTVDKTKLASNVSDVYIPWSYDGGSTTAVKINIDGNAKTADKVNKALSIAGKTYDGSAAVEVKASDLKTALKGQIGDEQIIDGSVATAKILNGAVTAAKIGADVTYSTIGLSASQVRTVYVGTAEPSSSTGSDGDIYLTYS